MRMTIASACIALVATLPPSPAFGQTALSAGQVVEGVITGSSELTSRGERHDCYVLNTAPGSEWQIDMERGPPDPSAAVSGLVDTVLSVGRGTDCASVETWDVTNDNRGLNDDNSRVRFVAGGGAYLVMARAFQHRNPLIRYFGTYTLTVTQTGQSAGRMLPPGVDLALVAPPPGTASTFAGATLGGDHQPG